jgi:hypothetical protein
MDKLSELAVATMNVTVVPHVATKESGIGWEPVWVVDKRPIDAVSWIEKRMPSTLVKNYGFHFSDTSERNRFLLAIDPDYKRVYDELRLDFAEKVEITDRVIAEGNLLVNVGMDLIWDGVIGNAPTVFSNANAAIGVGDSSTAAAVAQTNLQASSNKLRKGMNASFPDQPTNPSVRFQSDFTSSEANYHWQEVATFNNSTDGVGTMLHRLVADLGTKSSGATWTITVTITLS